MIEEDEEEDYRTFVGGYVSYALKDNLPEIISETPYFKPNVIDDHLLEDEDNLNDFQELEDFEGLDSVRYLFGSENETNELEGNKENRENINAIDIFPNDINELQIFDENELIVKPETDFLSKNAFDSDSEKKDTKEISQTEAEVKVFSAAKAVTVGNPNTVAGSNKVIEIASYNEKCLQRKGDTTTAQTKSNVIDETNENEETNIETITDLSDDTKGNKRTGIDGKENDNCKTSDQTGSNSMPIKDSKTKKNKSSEENVMQIIEKCQSDDAFILDLSKRELIEVPSAVLNLKDIKYLYLEGNGLTNLPECFFYELPAVQWLDLRNNRLSTLPSSIGSHVNLVHLLIEGNRFYKLTPEIGLLTTLRGLNFRNNPLQDPPPEILALGLRETLYYLRQKLPIYNEGAPTKASRSVLGTIKKRSGPFDPTRNSSLPSCRNKSYNPGKPYDGPSLETIETKAKVEKDREIQKLRKEHVDAIIQHIKNDLTLKTWRDKARHQQLKYMSMFDERDFISPALQAPFDIDEEYLPLPSRKQLQQKDNVKKQRYEISPGYMDAARLSKEKELEKKIRTHLEKLQLSSRDGNLDMDKAAQELRKVEQLQRELAQLFRPMM